MIGLFPSCASDEPGYARFWSMPSIGDWSLSQLLGAIAILSGVHLGVVFPAARGQGKPPLAVEWAGCFTGAGRRCALAPRLREGGPVDSMITMNRVGCGRRRRFT